MKSNLVYSILGVVFNTLFPIIVYPYITRVLGVDNLGEYNFYTATVSYLALLSGSCISIYATMAIGRLKDNRTAYSKVLGELISLNLLLSLVVYIIIFILIVFSDTYHNVKLFLVTSITILGNAIGCEYFFVALEKQRFLLIRNVTFKILSLVLILIFVRTHDDLLIYAFIMLLSTVGVSVTNIIAYWGKVDWQVIHYKDFHWWALFMPITNIFIIDIFIHYYGMMDVVILGFMDTNVSVGYYSVASKIYLLTYSFLASTAIPLLPRSAYYLEQGEINTYYNMIRRCYDIYLLISLILAFLLFFFADETVCLVAGVDFVPSGTPMRLFALTLTFSSFCNFFIFQIFYPNNQLKLIIKTQIVSVLTNVVLNIFLIPSFSFTGAAISFLVSFIVLFCMMLCLGHKYMPSFNNYGDLLREVIGVVVCWLCAVTMDVQGVYFVINMALCCMVYAILEYMLGNRTSRYLVGLTVNKIKKYINNKSIS